MLSVGAKTMNRTVWQIVDPLAILDYRVCGIIANDECKCHGNRAILIHTYIIYAVGNVFFDKLARRVSIYPLVVIARCPHQVSCGFVARHYIIDVGYRSLSDYHASDCLRFLTSSMDSFPVIFSMSRRSTATWFRHLAISISESIPGEYFSQRRSNPSLISSESDTL